MTSLRNSINTGFVIVSVLTFSFIFADKSFATDIKECSHTNNCKHDHIVTKGLTGYEVGRVLNFSKIINEGVLNSIMKEVPQNGREYRLRTIVLDAGHGGKDGGCSGTDSKEKNLTLEYVLNLGEMISAKYPDINVVYTRKKDEFIELYERANIANKNKADLFISIHCNWNPNTSPYGTETYVLGLHRAKDNLEVAKRENSSIYLENNYEKNYDGFDPNSPEGNILFSMCQNAHLDQSISLAEKIEKEFAVKSQRKSRGVRQAGFLVLRATSMPAILVETGFLSNKGEEDYMTSSKGKKEIVQNIFHGFEKYKASIEFSAEGPLATIKTAKSKPQSDAKDFEDEPEIVAQIVKDIEPVDRQKVQVKEPTKKVTPMKAEDFTTGKNGVEICVQLIVTKNIIDMSASKWSEFKNIIARNESDLLKYQVICSSLDEAGEVKTQAREIGFPEAFICAYRNGERISLEDLNEEGKMGSR